MAGVPINPMAVARALSKLRTPEWERGQILPIETNKGSGEMRLAVPGAIDSIARALMAPGDALQGKYPPTIPQGGLGRIDQYSPLIPPAMDIATNLTLGAGAIPGEGLGMGMRMFHGSPKTFDEFSPKVSKHGKTVFMTEDEGVAKVFTRGSPEGSVKEFDVEGKFFDPRDPKDSAKLHKAIEDNFGNWFYGSLFGKESAKKFASQGDWGIFERPEVQRWLKAKGYDGWRFSEGPSDSFNSVGVFNHAKTAKRIK
jgi:hypothetical protein